MTHTKTGTETMVTDRGTQSAPVAPDSDREHCCFCHRKFAMGVSIWKFKEGYSHPECARALGRHLE